MIFIKLKVYFFIYVNNKVVKEELGYIVENIDIMQNSWIDLYQQLLYLQYNKVFEIYSIITKSGDQFYLELYLKNGKDLKEMIFKNMDKYDVYRLRELCEFSS